MAHVSSLDSSPAADTEWPVHLVDRAAAAGLISPTVYGGVDRKRFIIEANGAGVALLDADDDGWLDALVLSGTRLREDGRTAMHMARWRGADGTALSQPA